MPQWEGDGYDGGVPRPLRIAYTLDPATWREYDAGMGTVDALDFVDSKPYPQKLEASAAKTGLREAMRYGLGRIEGREVVFGVLEFRFMGGSMGVVVGEKVTRAVELSSETYSADQMMRALRLSSPPVVGRIHDDVVLLDLRTLYRGEDRDAVVRAVTGLAERLPGVEEAPSDVR